MTEAKDTVMTYKQIQLIVDELSSLESTSEKVDLLRTELEAQAEITFPAGAAHEAKRLLAWVTDPYWDSSEEARGLILKHLEQSLKEGEAMLNRTYTNIRQFNIGPFLLMAGGKVLGHADNLTLDIAETTEEEMKILKHARVILLLKVDVAHTMSAMQEHSAHQKGGK